MLRRQKSLTFGDGHVQEYAGIFHFLQLFLAIMYNILSDFEPQILERFMLLLGLAIGCSYFDIYETYLDFHFKIYRTSQSIDLPLPSRHSVLVLSQHFWIIKIYYLRFKSFDQSLSDKKYQTYIVTDIKKSTLLTMDWNMYWRKSFLSSLDNFGNPLKFSSVRNIRIFCSFFLSGDSWSSWQSDTCLTTIKSGVQFLMKRLPPSTLLALGVRGHSPPIQKCPKL